MMQSPFIHPAFVEKRFHHIPSAQNHLAIYRVIWAIVMLCPVLEVFGNAVDCESSDARVFVVVGQDLFHCPPPVDTRNKKAVFHANFDGYFTRAQRFSLVFNHDIRAAVYGLLSFCRPSAVGGFVITLFIGPSVDGVSRCGFFSHISKKALESADPVFSEPPSITASDTLKSITLEAFLSSVVAPTLNGTPRVVFWGSVSPARRTVRKTASYGHFDGKATTAFRGSISQGGDPDFAFSRALTETVPISFPASRRSLFDYGEPAELLTQSIEFFHGDGFTI